MPLSFNIDAVRSITVHRSRLMPGRILHALCSPRSCMAIEANGAACERISERYHLDHSLAEGQRSLTTVENWPFLAVERGCTVLGRQRKWKVFTISNAR